MSQESPIFQVPDGTVTTETGAQTPVFLFVSFRHEAAENPAASDAAGHKVFDTLVMARVYLAGTRDVLDHALRRDWHDGRKEVLDRALHDKVGDRLRAWEEKCGEAATGTPLSVLNLSAAVEAQMRAVAVTTAEALAGLPDAALRALGPAGADWRARARAVLRAAQDAAPLLAAQSRAERAEREAEELRAELARLRAAAAPAPPRPPARRRKEAA